MDKYLSGSWQEFEQWIRFSVESDFRWHLRPVDTKELRNDVVKAIQFDLKKADAGFSKTSAFLERIHKGENNQKQKQR